MTTVVGRIERVWSQQTVKAVVEPLLREYLTWVVAQFAELGAPFDDPTALVGRHDAVFRGEIPNLLGPRGRLLVAFDDAQAVGVGALKPVDGITAEIKRMYVRPAFQGHGLGRAILQRLLADARAEGYRRARLETGIFMTTAQELYRSLGFVDTPAFDDSETALSDVQHHTRFMQLDL
jgi:GNAT superfamily N-acetyltransferase